MKKVVSLVLVLSMLISMICTSTIVVSAEEKEEPTMNNIETELYPLGEESAVIKGKKLWKDDNNEKGFRPESVTIELWVDDDVVATTVATSENDWSFSFEVPSYLDENGEPIKYVVKERDVANYEMVSSVDPTITVIGPTVTGLAKYTPCNELEINIAGSLVVVKKGHTYRVWTLEELTDEEKKAVLPTVMNCVGINNNSDIIFMHGYDNDNFKIEPGKIIFGKKSAWSLLYAGAYTEAMVKVTSATITNKLNTIELSVEKIWDDNDNQDGIRPNEITVELFANGEQTGKTLTLTAQDEWKNTFTDLVKYDNDNKEITYSVKEAAVEGYESVVNGFIVTNIHTPETVDVEGRKTWNDANDQDGIRPESITINLLANGEIIKTESVTAEDNWSWSFDNLPKYNAGNEIVYSITEEAVDGYETEVDGYNVTNTHIPETTTVEGKKIWNDANNQDGIRPESITITLLGDNTVVKTITVTAEDNWSWSFTDLPKYNSGKEIVYSISEEAVEGYVTTYSEYNVINSYAPEKKSVEIIKLWNDANDQDGIRPESITINLLANGEVIETVTVTAENGWRYTFSDLDKYSNGKEIEYTVTEEKVDGYETSVNGFVITNTYTPATTVVEGTKTWDDANDQDGLRPDEITINLLADGNIINTITVTSNDWSWSFDNLPKYRDGGVEIVYSITEEKVDGYETVVDGYNVTNKHTPATTVVEGTKTWDDANDQDGIRPDEITINLLADDKIIETITVTAADWSWSFDNLPKYRDGGVEIVYSITEEKVDGYETVVDGYNVTNKHTPATTVVEGTKTWDDANDQDGIRPESITINLLANGEIIKTITVTAADWSWKFEDLPKYNAGNEIVYSITEEKVDGYETVVDGYNVTNTHIPETTLVEGAKLWKDANDQDGLRPESITINLLADGTIIDTIVVRESDDWSFSFNDLPKYRDGGIKIVYTIAEEKVDGYETTLDGYLVVNTHIPETIILEGTKIWIDNNNQDGIRPTNIKINVLADGATIRTMIVTESDNWSWKLEDLPKYRDGGIEIVYTITEEAVDGYETTIDGFNITNTHTPSTTSVKVEKIWNDEDNADALRPETITVRLYADGVEIAKKEISSNDNWSCTFDSLAKYNNGKEIVYTVSEDAVNGYETTISGTAAEGFVITNTHEVVIPDESEPVEESPEESIPEESEPVEESLEESIPEESEPVEESPEESIPDESEPVEESPEESIPEESEPVEESPEESIPEESEPVEESPEESIPEESDPVEESPEESIPEESEPVEESPEESIPDESEPVEESPEESIPEESEPVEESPEESIPDESEPVEESPEESIPEESEPVEESPEESIPEESEPVEESPEESIPEESEPVEESPEESIPEESEPEEDDPLTDIYEDDVPLAPPEPPATGDKSITALLIMSITSLLVGSLVASKRRREL